ncbi:MAG: pro-sigmaK processing inhibitor BofA family protein [Clostridia bacterium]|nr:pro-sigmaK processing inhibitor BofA family protein [Clostridia bacterium]
MKTAVIILLMISVIALIIALFKSGHPLRQAVRTVLQGVLSLCAVNAAGLLTGVSLSVNWYTLGFVSIFGMPATIALTVLKFIFR